MATVDLDGRRAVSVEHAGLLIGVGRSLVWKLVADGSLRSVRAGHRVLVPLTAIDDFLAGKARTESPESTVQA